MNFCINYGCRMDEMEFPWRIDRRRNQEQRDGRIGWLWE
jgi:hypothetical protein